MAYFTDLNTETDSVDFDKINEAFDIVVERQIAAADTTDDLLYLNQLKHYAERVWDAYADGLSATEIADRAVQEVA